MLFSVIGLNHDNRDMIENPLEPDETVASVFDNLSSHILKNFQKAHSTGVPNKEKVAELHIILNPCAKSYSSDGSNFIDIVILFSAVINELFHIACSSDRSNYENAHALLTALNKGPFGHNENVAIITINLTIILFVQTLLYVTSSYEDALAFLLVFNNYLTYRSESAASFRVSLAQHLGITSFVANDGEYVSALLNGCFQYLENASSNVNNENMAVLRDRLELYAGNAPSAVINSKYVDALIAALNLPPQAHSAISD